MSDMWVEWIVCEWLVGSVREEAVCFHYVPWLFSCAWLWVA